MSILNYIIKDEVDILYEINSTFIYLANEYKEIKKLNESLDKIEVDNENYKKSNLKNFYKFIDELNAKKEFPERLIITNEEAPLSEEQVKKHFSSINDLSTVIDEDQGFSHRRFARALDFYLVQDFASSLGDLDKMIEAQPSFFPSYFMRALIKYKQLEYLKMEKEYDVSAVNEENKTIKPLDYELIKKDLDIVVELAPDFVYGYYNRANIYSLMKDYRAALVDYNKAIQLDPKFADAYFNRGLINIYLGNNRQGILDLSKAGELGLYSAYNIIKRFTDRKE